MNELIKVSTKELVEELSRRNAVEVKEVGPYKDEILSINGPAIVLIVTD